MPQRVRYVVWIGYWIGLFVIMHKPLGSVGDLPFSWADKVIHFVLYFLLVLLGAWCLRGAHGDLAVRYLVGWAVLYAIYGAVDEWLQGYVQRTPSVADWLADLLGIAAATAVAALWQRRGSSSASRGKTGPEST